MHEKTLTGLSLSYEEISQFECYYEKIPPCRSGLEPVFEDERVRSLQTKLTALVEGIKEFDLDQMVYITADSFRVSPCNNNLTHKRSNQLDCAFHIGYARRP